MDDEASRALARIGRLATDWTATRDALRARRTEVDDIEAARVGHYVDGINDAIAILRNEISGRGGEQQDPGR